MNGSITRTFLVWALALLLPLSAQALDITPDQFDRMLQKYDAATVEAARSYARTFNMKQMFERSIPALRQSMMAQLRAKNQALNEQQISAFFEAFMQSALVDAAPVLEQATILIMLDVLTKEEIVALNQFYSSSVGREILAKMPVVLGRIPEVMGLMQTYIIPRALEVAREQMKKSGVDVRI